MITSILRQLSAVLSPKRKTYPLETYLTPDEFQRLKSYADDFGITTAQTARVLLCLELQKLVETGVISAGLTDEHPVLERRE
jgi:hypothetical protein